MVEIIPPRKELNHIEQEQLKRIMSQWKLTPATFALKISRGHWIPSPHLQYLSLRIAKSLAKGNARIIVSMPPRHGKSELLSVYTPAWILEYLKNVNIILASYGADLAEGFARRVRGIISDPNNADLLKVKLGNLKQVEQFNTQAGGYMYAVGLGGAITGRGAHVLMIDDYIKEIKEALSPAYRDYVWNWYVTTALTRLEPNGSVIITATRWHSDDLIGRLLASERENWEYIEFPAIACAGDLIGRTPGTPLFPERYPLKRLDELRKSLGTVFFSALYQQRPVDESMAITDTAWLNMWPKEYALPRSMSVCRIWDLACTEGAGDFLVGTKSAYDPVTERFIILDVQREQIGPGKVEAFVKRIAEIDGVGCPIGIEQEPGAAGKILIQHYATNVLPQYEVVAISTGGKSKVIRAQPFLAAAEEGKVYLFQNQRWNKEFVTEFETFPSSNKQIHDDMIDTAGEGYTFLTGKKPLSTTWGSRATANNKQTEINGPQNLMPNRKVDHRNSAQLKAEQSRFARTTGATWGKRSKVDSY